MFGQIHGFLNNFYKYRFLLLELIKKDIKAKYKDSVLGLLWSFFNPLLQMIVLTIVFSTFFGHRIPNYPVYLLTGRLVFDFFANGTRGSMSSIRSNASIIKKIYVPKYMFSLGVVASEFVNFLISLVVLVMVMIATRAPFYISLVYTIIPIFLLIILIIGVGLILTTLTTFFTYILYLWGVMITMLTYLTPIFYPISIIPDKYIFFFKLNPIFAVVYTCRQCIMYNSFPNIHYILYLAAWAFASLIIGVYIFYKYQDQFILNV